METNDTAASSSSTPATTGATSTTSASTPTASAALTPASSATPTASTGSDDGTVSSTIPYAPATVSIEFYAARVEAQYGPAAAGVFTYLETQAGRTHDTIENYDGRVAGHMSAEA
jgi:hypothetical protein